MSITEKLPQNEYWFTYSRSSGKGGQNVNKVESRATINWPVVASPWLNEDVKMRFIEKFGSRINSDGIFTISSEKFRDQWRNSKDCLEKLEALLESVWRAPKPRKKTRPTRASKERRHQEKRRQKDIKLSRARIKH